MSEAESTIKLELTPLVLTRQQVAKMLQVSEDTIGNLHRVGQLPGCKIGKHLRWRISDVCKYIEGLA